MKKIPQKDGNYMKHAEVFGKAKWMEAPMAPEAPLFRKKVTFNGLEKAEINIIGLGVFHLYINGQLVGDELYAPLHSDYHERSFKVEGKDFDEELAFRMYVCKYDITKYLKEGENVIGIWLAAGWYGNKTKQPFKYGNCKVCFNITAVENGKERNIVSDESLLCSESCLRNYFFFTGEEYDYNFDQEGWSKSDFDDSGWENAIEVKVSDVDLYFEDCPYDKEIRTIQPKLIWEGENVKRFDIGEDVSGYPVLKVAEDTKGTITVRISENLKEDGTLDEERTFDQVLTYHLDGKERILKPQFTWITGQYFEVEGDAEVLNFTVVHTDVEEISSFESNNEILNWIYDAFIRTQRVNMHRGIPSDCPHRERRGYTGDGQLICELAMMTLDTQKFFKKWMGDISDCQDRITGHVQYTAPYDYTSGGPGGWGCAIAVVPYMYYKHYGDIKPFEKMLPQMLRYFDYLRAHSEENLVTSDKIWCLGDWATPATNNEECWIERVKIPAPLVNTYFFVKTIDLITEVLPALGKEDLIEDLLKERKVLCDAIIKKYYDEESGNFAENIQGANSFAIDIGLGDERTVKNMAERYKEHGMYDTGIFGTELVTKLLFEKGEADLAYDLLTSEKEHTFYSMKKGGQNTLWEHWSGDGSRCHPMFGAVIKFFFKNILGIKQPEAMAGYESVVIAPSKITRDLDAKGSLLVKGGKIEVSRKKTDGGTLFVVLVPESIDAKFVYGGKTVKVENGKLEILCED